MEEKENLKKWFEKLPDEAKKKFSEGMTKAFSYEPKVAIFGKTGVGKSSITNALFGKDVCKISDVEACTRDPQEVFMKLDGAEKGIKLLDVPGLGESSERDKEYFKLYAEILKDADMVLWVLKGDDRTFTTDEEFYKTCMKPYMDKGKPFVVAVNQVDKIEPYREWDEKNQKPGENQEGNIAKKINYVAKQFGDLKISQVVAVSANEKYNLDNLVLSLIDGLPADKKFQTINNMDETIQKNEQVKAKKRESFIDLVNEIIDTLPLPELTKKAGKIAVSFVNDVIGIVGDTLSSIWDRITAGW